MLDVGIKLEGDQLTKINDNMHTHIYFTELVYLFNFLTSLCFLNIFILSKQVLHKTHSHFP